MAAKTKTKAEVVKPRNVIKVDCQKDTNFDDAIARTLIKPSIMAAATIQKWGGDTHEVNALASELSAQIKAVNDGDLKQGEGFCVAQAHTLDQIFNILAMRAHSNMLGGYLPATETYLRLALKAQSQCRATLETLALIKNPPMVYAKQANIANTQQVNNGIPTRTRETEIVQNKLLEKQDGERLDFGTTRSTIGTDPQLETVGTVNGGKNARRKKEGE